jgi:hypothetical protein
MAAIIERRVCSEIKGGFVLSLIGIASTSVMSNVVENV